MFIQSGVSLSLVCRHFRPRHLGYLIRIYGTSVNFECIVKRNSTKLQVPLSTLLQSPNHKLCVAVEAITEESGAGDTHSSAGL